MAERPGSTGGAPLPVWSLPGPRGRSQSDISSFSSSRRTRQLRSNVGGSVDGLDKASVANSDGPAPGSQTPPFKRKGKLSTIGKIFKPWKWRKKKTSDKFRETSAVLERKISTRQSREELIRRGVLKEMPEQDGDVTVNFETSNGHTIAIGEETIQEENVLKASGDNGISSEKASALEGKKEDQKESTTDHCPEIPATHAPPLPKPKPKSKKAPLPPKNAIAASSTTSHKSNEAPHAKKKGKAPAKQPSLPPPKPTSHGANRDTAGSSHVKKTLVSKSSSSPSPSTSSHPKASKETSSKSSTSGTPRGKKKTGKHSAPRTAPDGAASSPSGATANSLEVKAKKLEPEQPSILISETEDANQASKLVVPPPPTSAPPPPPLPPPFPAGSGQPTVSSDAQEVSDGCAAGPAVPGSDAKPPLQAEHGTDDSHALDSGPDAGGGDTKSLATKEDQEGEAPDQAHSELVEEASDTAAPPESESSRESHSSDSDSDGPILYTDDDDDDDDNASAESSLASKIRRRDTLAIKLGNRPSKKELEDKNILQRTSEEERQEIRHQIGTKLVRRLSQRPTTEELEQRNILKQKNEEEEQEAKREIKRKLSRKLSLRPTVAELQARRILRFNEYVEVTDSPDYDRRADKPWARLTPADKAAIRKELNEFKSTEMEVHEESRQFTRFHRP
ncbi:phosphatase and actin regulator 2 isoform X6 [Pezoporus flaviventris]|uniref:phosphatase and actin regulator 2 isoform X6 n=1 Tax=Pezoporus flaviventris TaxID=889875 RepID=UPI002AB2D368|nr:phosphatase and actin regulator 2 isoform X6 [Pezoporus flaviventris]